MAHTACLVCFISTENCHCNNNKKKEEAYPWKASASSGHTTNLKQSILRLSINLPSSRQWFLPWMQAARCPWSWLPSAPSWSPPAGRAPPSSTWWWRHKTLYSSPAARWNMQISWSVCSSLENSFQAGLICASKAGANLSYLRVLPKNIRLKGALLG